MAVSRQSVPAEQPAGKAGDSVGVAELVGEILDKGIIVDAWARVSVIGLEVLTIEARVVVASVATYLRYSEAIGLTATAAPPRGQQAASGRDNEQDRLSEDEVLRYLFDHPEGLQLGELQAHFNAPRWQLADIVNHLVEQNKVRRDEEHDLYLPVRRDEEHKLYLPEER